MKLLDGVILDETIPDQVRFHCVICMGKKVLAALTQTDGVFPLQTQTMHFGSGNKLCLHYARQSLGNFVFYERGGRSGVGCRVRQD